MPQLDQLETKDPNDVVDYHVNWARYLDRVDDVITASEWLLEDGVDLEIDDDDSDATITTVWLSGGTAGTDYPLTNRITTAGGRTLDRTITIRVRDR